MDIKKQVEEIRSQLTGNKLDDYHFIQDKMNELAKNPETIEVARALAPTLLEIVDPEHLNKLRESMKKEIGNREMLFAKAENLLKENKLENAKVVLDKIAYQLNNLFEDDETYHYINIEEPFAFQVYTNLKYKERKIVRFAPDHLFKYHYLRGVVNMKLGLIDDAEEAYNEALRWFPNSFSVLLELANVAIARRELDKVPGLIAEAQKYCFVPTELARCFRAIGYYGIVKEDYRLAMAGYLTSTIFDANVNITKELGLAAQKLGQTEFKPLTPDESKEELHKVGLVFGANPELIKMGVVLGNEFANQKAYPTAIYFLKIAHSLTMDEKIKERIEELEKLAKNN
jgi:tetratricopeptide (TPR) repeat protein